MIIISPYSQKLKDGKPNCKNYPWWNLVVSGVKKYMVEKNGADIPFLQIGVNGEQEILGIDRFEKNLSIKDIEKRIKDCVTWISGDNFFHHLAWTLNKPGVVIFSRSDPKYYGHPGNINLLKDTKYLRPDPFGIWENCPYDEEAFISPDIVVHHLLRFVVGGEDG